MSCADPKYDMEGLPNFPPEVLEHVKQARLEARSIIERLAPRHINSWPELIQILKDCLLEAESNLELICGTKAD